MDANPADQARFCTRRVVAALRGAAGPLRDLAVEIASEVLRSSAVDPVHRELFLEAYRLELPGFPPPAPRTFETLQSRKTAVAKSKRAVGRALRAEIQRRLDAPADVAEQQHLEALVYGSQDPRFTRIVESLRTGDAGNAMDALARYADRFDKGQGTDLAHESFVKEHSVITSMKVPPEAAGLALKRTLERDRKGATRQSAMTTRTNHFDRQDLLENVRLLQACQRGLEPDTDLANKSLELLRTVFGRSQGPRVVNVKDQDLYIDACGLGKHGFTVSHHWEFPSVEARKKARSRAKKVVRRVLAEEIEELYRRSTDPAERQLLLDLDLYANGQLAED